MRRLACAAALIYLITFSASAALRCKLPNGDCSPEAVKNRVLAAFPNVEVAEVLECVYGLNSSCSQLPTEETCLVRVTPGALDEYPFVSHSRLTPSAVAGFASKHNRIFRVISIDRPPQSIYEKVIYADQDRSLAILFSTETCLHIEEVI